MGYANKVVGSLTHPSPIPDSPAAARASVASPTVAITPVPSLSAADIVREAADFARLTRPDAHSDEHLQNAEVKYDMEMRFVFA